MISDTQWIRLNYVSWDGVQKSRGKMALIKQVCQTNYTEFTY